VAVIALDPFGAEAEQFWRERFGSAPHLVAAAMGGEERPRPWMPLY
jgi:hypothetical protein